MNHVDSAETVAHLEWCAGYGGIHLGLSRVIPGLRLVALSEIEAYACALLVSHMEAGRMDAAPIWTDCKTFPCSEFRGLVDIFSAGFPCQPFSLAGSRQADSDPRHLWPYILGAVIAIRPRAVFLENVEGIISAKLGGDGWTDPQGTPVLLHVCRELERVGYRTEAGIFSAAECGASHRRKRVFILAVASGESLPRWRDARNMAGAPGEAESISTEWEWMRHAARDGGSNVDHAPSARCDATGIGAEAVQCGGQCVPCEGCGNVAYAGCSERWPEAGPEQHEAGQGSDRLGERGGCLADTSRERRGEGRAESGGEQGRHDAAECSRQLPSFPPGPGELDRWADILARYPWLAPAIEAPTKPVIHRVANEPPIWLDERHMSTLVMGYDKDQGQRREDMPNMQSSFQSEAHKREDGGRRNIHAAAVLLPSLCVESAREAGGRFDAKRSTGSSQEEYSEAMHELRGEGSPVDSPHRQGLEEQCAREPTNALLVVSHVLASFGGGYSTEARKAAVRCLWEAFAETGALLHSPDAIQEVWRSAGQEGQSRIILGAVTLGLRSGNRVDRLRLCGNGVVPATVAKAFTVLAERLTKLP